MQKKFTYSIKKQKKQSQTSENEVLGQGGNPCPFCAIRSDYGKESNSEKSYQGLSPDGVFTDAVRTLFRNGRLFVGRAAGDTGLAAVNLAWPLVAVITATGIGIGSGGSVLFSNLAGKDEKQESEKTYHLTVCLLVGVGILLSVILFLTYPILLQVLGAR